MSYFAVLNGTPIYAISKKDYIDGMLKKALDPTAYYMVVDADNMMFSDGELYGRVVDKGRGVKKMPTCRWQKALGYEEPKVKAKVLSERPTVEAMATEGSKRLKAVLDEAPVAQASAEAKLNELVAEGEKAVEKVIAEGEAIRKNVSTTPVETPVKRKRTNPSSRKRTSV
jgi:hypothetical protein